MTQTSHRRPVSEAGAAPLPRLAAAVAVVLLAMSPTSRPSADDCPFAGGCSCYDMSGNPVPCNGGATPPDDDRPLPTGGGAGCAGTDAAPPPPPAVGSPHPQHAHVVRGDNGWRPAEGYTWIDPDDPDDLRVKPLPAGTPHPRLAHVVASGNGGWYTTDGYTWANPDDVNDLRVTPLPDGAPHPRIAQVIASGDGSWRAAEGYRWVAPDDTSDLRVEPLPEGAPHPRIAHVIASGDGNWRAAEGYTWANELDEHDLRVVPLPAGTPHPRSSHVVADGAGKWRPADGYTWAHPADDSDLAVVPRPPPPPEVAFSGAWNGDAQLAVDTLAAIPDPSLQQWIAAHATFRRFSEITSPGIPETSILSADGEDLKFKDGFFVAGTSTGRRLNTLAFEAGKVCWNEVKDRPWGGNRTVRAWAAAFASRHAAALRAMQETRYAGESMGDLSTDQVDTPSAFAHAFRALALELPPPSEPAARQAWEATLADFRTTVLPLLQGE